jgi:HD-GYP domain-containing protein (c-di-GMP phosphodiesterase class II)
VAALAEIEANTGTQFCARVVEALRAMWRKNPHLLAREQPPQRDAA